jgi:hypothetical protein
LFLTGCVTSLQKENQSLRERLTTIDRRLSDQEVELTRVKHTLEAEISRVSSRLECHDDRVRDFIRECEQDSPVCSENGVANALTFMSTQPYVVQYLRPGQSFEERSMPLLRRGQLMTLADISTWRPSTKFLVLVQPRSDADPDQQAALQVGGEVKRYMREYLIAKKYPILGPKVLPCKLKAEQLAKYFKRNDLPAKGEPRENEPHVRIWIFKTDC